MTPFNIAGETERLIIRPYELGDYSNWLEQLHKRKLAVHKHDSGWQNMSGYTEEQYQARVEHFQKLAADDVAYVFGIFRKKDGVSLGGVDVATLIRGEFQWARMGYALHNQHWGQGYGKEAASKLLELALMELKFHRIEAHINIDNPASIALAKSIGMEFECTRKGFIYEFGAWTDNLIYVKNADDPAPPADL
ncbi:GNAT family N-acetyltransferase [Paenibacillus marinisediminis]